MRLGAIWVVRDPSPTSTLGDIFWRTTIDALVNYITGARQGNRIGVWESERHTVYTKRAEAEADALARLAARKSTA